MHQKDNIIEAFINRTISVEERRELKKWILGKKANKEHFKNKIREYAAKDESVNYNFKKAYDKFLEEIKVEKRPKTVQRFIPYAAAIALLIGLGYLVLIKNSDLDSIDAVVQKTEKDTRKDIVLTLADGTKKVISTDGSTSLIDKNGNIIASSEDGVLSFENTNESASKVPIFNEIYVPYGQKFKLTLSDGTTVWLNSGSRLKFQQNMQHTKGNRRAYLDGEAFFSVAKNTNRPFIITINEVDVKVLGTAFNISGYNGEKNVVTTLVEGSVEVYQIENEKDKLLLKPMDQALFDKKESKFSKEKVDTSIYTAWMQDRLVINGLGFNDLKVKLERLYNVSITCSSENLDKAIFKGEFENENLETILKTIATSTPFNYKVQGNEVTITN
jgi:ferric-dicitrate binding protein FerR (iron transport regulator)